MLDCLIKVALLLALIFILVCRALESGHVDASHDHNPIKVNEEFEKMVKELRDENIDELHQAVKNEDEQFLFFYADWCPACFDFKPILNLLVENDFFKNLGVQVRRVNVVDNPLLTARFMITSLPTLIHIRSGEYRNITKRRWKLIEYFENKEWTQVDSLKSWRSPFGPLAVLLGHVTAFGHFVSKEAESLKWSKGKWASVFFVVFTIAWAPVIYLGFWKRENAGYKGKNVKQE